MIRPVDMQLSLWRLEEAAQRRNPEAAPAQALQDEETVAEARLRDSQVQSSEKTEGRRVGDEDRDKKEGRQGRRRPRRDQEAEDLDEERGEGLDLMA